MDNCSLSCRERTFGSGADRERDREHERRRASCTRQSTRKIVVTNVEAKCNNCESMCVGESNV